MTSKASDIIQRYLQDSIASERVFESQLRRMEEEASTPEVRNLFATHAEDTKRQYERLTARLHVLGGAPSTTKSILAHFFGAISNTAQIGHLKGDKTTQNLVIAYAVEQSEAATYEALKIVAEELGDLTTANLAEEIQREEQITAQRIWNLIPSAVRASVKLQAPETWEGKKTARGGDMLGERGAGL